MSKSIKKWKILDSKTLLDYKNFKIVEDTVQLPNNQVSTYIKRGPSSTDSVCIIAINQDQEILIQREYSHPPQKIMWQLPGGSMNENEEIITAANRELGEESGIQARDLQVIGAYYTNNRLWDQKQHVVVAKQLYENKLDADYDEFIESHWLSLDEILGMIKTGKIVNINMLAALNIWLQKREASETI